MPHEQNQNNTNTNTEPQNINLGEGYYQRVLDNPTARPEAQEEARRMLGIIQETDPVISSVDDEQEFRTNGDDLDTKLGEDTGEVEITPPQLDTGTPEAEKAKVEIETTGDPLVDAYNRGISNLQLSVDEANRIAAERAEQEKRFYDTSLAAIDATAAAQIESIGSIYDKRLAEQRRINQLNVDRVKAYGLAGGGRFTPISFQDAISTREKEAADQITRLERMRNSELGQARAARDRGEAGLLREKMNNVRDIEDQLRGHLADAQEAAEKQYQLFVKIREQQEVDHQKKVDELHERFTGLIAPALAAEYAKLSDEEKVKFVENLVAKGFGDFLSVYSGLEQSVTEQDTATRKKQKEIQDLASSKALERQRKASTAKTLAQTEQIKNEAAGGDFSPTNKDKLEQVGLQEAPRQIQLDYIYGDEAEKSEALEWINNQGGGSNGLSEEELYQNFIKGL